MCNTSTQWGKDGAFDEKLSGDITCSLQVGTTAEHFYAIFKGILTVNIFYRICTFSKFLYHS